MSIKITKYDIGAEIISILFIESTFIYKYWIINLLFLKFMIF